MRTAVNKISVILKSSVCILILLLSFCASGGGVNAKILLSKAEVESYLDNISLYEIKKVVNPSFGSAGGEWLVTGLSRYGTISDSFLNTYKNNLKKHIMACKGRLSEKKYSEYARVVITLTAIGENPQNYAGHNLLEPLAELDNVKSSGIVSVIYTLIALDCGNYDVTEPKNGYQGEKTTRNKLKMLILDSQLDDGGWAIMGKNADSDITAMAVQALAPYYRDDKNVKKIVDDAIECLSKMQEKDGAFSSGGKINCESTAQVLAALSEVRISINDSRFIKNGNTVIDGLLQFYDNGAFSHLKNTLINQMSTEQALYGLVAYYRGLNNMNRLFDMSDGIVKRELKDKTENTNTDKHSNSDRKKNKKDKDNNKEKQYQKINKNKTGEVVSNKKVSTNEVAINDRKVSKSSKTNNEKIEKEELIERKKEDSRQITDKEQKKESDKKEKNDKYILLIIICAFAAAVIWRVIYRKKIRTGAALLILIVAFCFSGCEKGDSDTAGTCTLFVECSTIFDNLSKLDKSLKDYIPKDGIILEKKQVGIEKGDSVYDVLRRELKKENILMEASFTAGNAYIEGIDNIYEFSCGELSGWSYCVNDKYTSKSSSEYKVKDKDRIEWHYTCDLGEDLKK